MPDRWIDPHIGDETTPRPGFADELEARLVTAWSTDLADETRRVAVVQQRPRRVRWTTVAGVSAAAALIAALTAIAIVRADGSAPTPGDPTPVTAAPVPTASSSATTSTPTTSPPSTIPAVPTPATDPTTWVPTDSIPTDSPEGFFPACSDRAGPAAATPATAPPTFGPLQADPALTIWLPASVDPAGFPATQRVTSPKATVALIPGGVLVMLNQANGQAGSLVAAVNLDGSTRWVRCTSTDSLVTPDLITPLGDDQPAFVRLRNPEDLGDPAPRWLELDLRTGDFGALLMDRVAEANPDLGALRPMTVVGQSETQLLLASYSPLSGQDDLLLLVNRLTLQAVRLPDAGASASNLQTPGLDDLGRPTLSVAVPTGGMRMVGVYIGGAWVADDRVLADAVTAVGFDAAIAMSPLRAVDGTGSTVWQVEELTDPGDEGFRARASGELTLARGCLDAPREPGSCRVPALVALRTADGSELWRVEGSWDVGPAGDGFALIREPLTYQPDGTTSAGAWHLIDIASGPPEPVQADGQQWADPSTFATGCCGEFEFVHTERHGGVVLSVNERRISIWFPAGSDLSPATATLP